MNGPYSLCIEDCGRRQAQLTECPDAGYVRQLPDAERERRMAPWGYDSWDDVDLDAVECKSYVGSEDGSLACYTHNCPGEEIVELLGQPVEFESGHPGDFCEVYQCIECGRTGKMYSEHFLSLTLTRQSKNSTIARSSPGFSEDNVGRFHRKLLAVSRARTSRATRGPKTRLDAS